MPREPLCECRRSEIIKACRTLYCDAGMTYLDITIKDIAAQTSFTRTSIYNYFHTKEEIFLALLADEYLCWSGELNEASASSPEINAQDFACLLGETLQHRATMLKLLVMNLYDMERDSNIEELVRLKSAYCGAIISLKNFLGCIRPALDEDQIQRFITVFLPFMFGLYPYSEATPKQLEAMKLAGCTPIQHSIKVLVCMEVCYLLN